MRLIKFSVTVTIALFVSAFLGGCSDDDGVDNRDLKYGYVQFKLYKEASYEKPQQAPSRAAKPQLDYLSQASKVKVTLTYGDATITQTLILSAADKENAEFGMRSEKLRLQTGEYEVVTYSLYDALDELLYYGTAAGGKLQIVAGGLTQHDLTAKVTPRGRVQFTLVKDIAADLPNRPDTRAVERQYTFDEIVQATITVQNKVTNELTKFERLPMKFSVHFDDDETTDGYQTSSSRCDSLLSLPAGDYRILSYETYDENKILLENNTRPKNSDFTVADNKTTQAEMTVTLYEADEYIKDGYALYAIWKALDGENWYYDGENFPRGINWDFNKDPDMWYAQPGVEVHSNGRVAKITLSDFGFRGDMPEALGQLTELIELYLGTHNDTNTLEYDPSLSPDKSLSERNRNRLQYHKEYLSMIHPATQMSEPCALALRLHGIHIPATSLYDKGLKEDEIIDRNTGLQIRPKDMNPGKLCNGLRSLPKSIGKLKKLEYLFIANGEITELPEELALLESCTDVEVYNCPKMTKFPMPLTRMPKLISLNIGCNPQWTDIDEGMDALAKGEAAKELQILYARDNKLTAIPESFSNLKKIGLLDLSGNRISQLSPLGKEVAPVQLFLDNNQIESFPVNSDGIFCNMDDLESMSVQYNKLTEFPNIFSSKTKFTIKDVNFAGNQIGSFPADFKGINVTTLTLSGNRLTKFPKCFGETNSYVAYVILRANQIDEIPEGSFKGKYSSSLISLDLTYNKLTKFPKDFTAEDLPFLYGLDISFNSFSSFPFEPLSAAGLTVYAIRGQRDANGGRCLREWPKGLAQHTGLRGFYIGSNDLRKIDDTISTLIFHLEISDNPNITFDASDVCYSWKNGVYNLIYDKSQNIIGCDEMLK